MPRTRLPRDDAVHLMGKRTLSAGSIAGASIGAVAAAILITICVLPFVFKANRKRRLRERLDQEQNASHGRLDMGPAGSLPTHGPLAAKRLDYNKRYSASRLSAAGTSSDRDSQAGKEYGGLSPSLGTRRFPPASSPGSRPVPALGPHDSAPGMARPDSWSQVPGSHADLGTSTFGSMTAEPEPISRSATESLKDASEPSSIGNTLRKFSAKAAAAFRQNSTRSSGSGSQGTGARSPTVDLTALDQSPATQPYVHPLVYEIPPEGGSAMEYYSGASMDYYHNQTALMSPPAEGHVPMSSFNPGPQFIFNHLLAMPDAASRAGGYVPYSHPQPASPNQLGSPFNPPGSPLSPASANIKEEDVSDDGELRTVNAQSESLSQQPTQTLKMKVEGGEKKFVPPPSPIHRAPGTVNPADIMQPSNAQEQSYQIDLETWKFHNSPPPESEISSPPQIENSPPAQADYSNPPLDYSTPPQAEPSYQPERPQFATVVRRPTEGDLTDGNGFAQTEQDMVQYISASDISSSPNDRTSYETSDHTSPDTRLTEPDSNYTSSPSPRSSNNAPTPYIPLDYPAGTAGPPPGMILADSTALEPKSFSCDECGRTFDQVHKLNHHKRYHERPHHCTQCDKRFGTKTHLDRHINDKHNKTRKYHCTVGGCPYSKQGGKSFPRKDNWRRHMQNKHQQQDPPEPIEEDVTMAGL